ncbi:dihydrofolate reductase [Liquorilactobacillus aquaticus DSM 21051]|uniref:Dihydrofolate reductase n=1 Tax=Liquorilactobacillus aquaticus DSM 21051 TaxID=1423725 RepID=A0A0R2CYK3_9LACO|nr:dihydrofolate reductase [Liquorilactobacillus aquaticus]KRM96330.1 dihydrofolate reductase [Liquorilactobacillus aquaticus DSM 21051]
MLAYIWAEDEKRHIGYQGRLPWRLPADLAYFKEKTLNHPIIMGRKTFESFKGFLPRRHHIVLTSSKDFEEKYNFDERLTVVHSIPELRKLFSSREELLFVIGGASLFGELLDDVDFLYVTKINALFKADTSMPKIDCDKFELITKIDGIRDQKNLYDHRFEVYQRRRH